MGIRSSGTHNAWLNWREDMWHTQKQQHQHLHDVHNVRSDVHGLQLLLATRDRSVNSYDVNYMNIIYVCVYTPVLQHCPQGWQTPPYEVHHVHTRSLVVHNSLAIWQIERCTLGCMTRESALIGPPGHRALGLRRLAVWPSPLPTGGLPELVASANFIPSSNAPPTGRGDHR